MTEKSILLIVSGGIAAYKSLELVRLLKKQGVSVRAVMTKSAAEFVTPLSLGVLTEDHVYGNMFDLKEESEIGHIQLSRQADLIVICPATANIMAKMAAGIADDLATTILLATDKPVLAVPAMNVRMWQHAATQRNMKILADDGINIMQPDEGDMACGEYGPGRLPDPEKITTHIMSMLGSTHIVHAPLAGQPDFAEHQHRPLYGKKIVITAGPTHEPIDPVRYIANRSSGRQGFAIAEAAAEAGAEVILVAGPVHLTTPAGVIRMDVESARDMERAVQNAMPCDVAIMVAAVADWRTADAADQKIKKNGDAPAPLKLTENPDILTGLAKSNHRPPLLIGFAAETEKLSQHAAAKLAKKGCDWIVANDVSGDVMGGDNNQILLVTQNGNEQWADAPKHVVARKLIAKIAEHFQK
ncbi:bifunctional phosphopantothenoylcysteine decarboxylase/phosphopantothenate synthase [Sphingorhabdus lutea]|uniref:Coenzyme A biosynthesis bifunctional protein CoaBC n=1 Tax=Sphingorhabdus lutea TaxID=1913578 RepID=A0A1L3JEQ8_9SPHN|nr:bifunctional phosphopantothenoylcysteine decarboxylase/phosphopantothenate--cysteine ligase CoaBC [Sphingorhabdus lutea]APG63628.1 bifunctional phosphopantothenoylcysteine decarboxylase/phosphopantothenate synthase [Sphingorhabdus lutea]